MHISVERAVKVGGGLYALERVEFMLRLRREAQVLKCGSGRVSKIHKDKSKARGLKENKGR